MQKSLSPLPSPVDIKTIVAAALREDIGSGDITAELIPAEQTSIAEVISREAAILCGQAWVNEVFRQLDAAVTLDWHSSDGDTLIADTTIVTIKGSTRSILTGERTALNFLQTLSATATVSARYSSLVTHTSATLLDTRKTLPGLRSAQKYAVRVGGSGNHRMGLFDAFLIKENHIMACGSITAAIESARKLYADRKIEIEVETEAEYLEAVEAAPDIIMLDNFNTDRLKWAVSEARKLRATTPAGAPIRLEASGGIESDEDLVAIAETGVDYISIGAMTKHCRAIDLSLRLKQT